MALLMIVILAGCKKDHDTGAAPTVTSTNPQNNVTGVARNTGIAFTFSKAMNPATINTSTFTLMQGTTPVAGTVTYSGTTATFTPSAPLLPATMYTATITTGAKDLSGNSLAVNKVWSFTTGGTTSTLAGVDLVIPFPSLRRRQQPGIPAHELREKAHTVRVV